MSKKKITIIVAGIVIACIAVVILLFNIKSYTVMYNTNGGSFVATEKVKVFKRATRPADPIRDGYTFDNWYYNDGIFDFDTKITQDMVIEARWIEGSPVAGTFVVSFNSNGGSSIASVRTNADGTVNQPADPVREGYKFVAWQYKGEDFDFGSKVTSNMTLVAKWEEDNTDPNKSVPAEKVTVAPTNVSLSVGNTRRIAVALAPKEATNRTMKWTTSNNRVATVDNNGTIRAVGVGTATITVEVDGVKATVTVTVTKATTPVNPNNPTKPNNPSTPADPANPTNPTDPGNKDPEPDVPTPPVTETYTYEMVEVGNLKQVDVYVKNSKGQYVAGKVRITLLNGTVDVQDVPSTGLHTKYITAVISTIEVISGS